MNKDLTSIIVAMSLLTLVGCGDSSDNETNELDTEVRSAINSNDLTGNPAEGVAVPSITDAKVKLGMKLFFSKSMGGDKDSACVTCHHPILGGGDDLSLPIGTESWDEDLLGKGRVYDPGGSHFTNGGDALVPRNSPTTYNVALWKKSLFWDGRIENIVVNGVSGIRTPDTNFTTIDINAGANLAAAQARFPVTSPEEMRGHSFEAGNSTTAVRDHLTLRLTDPTSVDYIANIWEPQFAPVYGDDNITFDNIADAIGAYENSQVFIESPWKDYVEGNPGAISDSAKRGAKLFYSSVIDGGMSCVSCHSGDFFTDEDFHVMAVPQVGHGKGDGDGSEDFGRYRESQNAADKYAFRTPSLLNVEKTGPYGHDGAYVTLVDMVSHMVDPDKSISNYSQIELDGNVLRTSQAVNTQKALAQLNAQKLSGVSLHQTNTAATAENIDDLVSFLKALTDPCLNDKECIGKWIADEKVIDGLELNAKDETGTLLSDKALLY